jgi:hypothetical protein
MLSLGETLVRSVEPSSTKRTIGASSTHSLGLVRAFGCRLYVLAYGHFDGGSDGFCRQEVLSCLVAHVGSGSVCTPSVCDPSLTSHPQRTETDAGLDALLQIAQQNHTVARTSATFLTSLLDYLEVFSDVQLRKVFLLFGTLMFADGSGAGEFGSVVPMSVTKHLSNPLARHKRVGVIGGIALLQRITTAASAEALLQGGELLRSVEKSALKNGVRARSFLVTFFLTYR